jgi:DNA repair photolyase
MKGRGVEENPRNRFETLEYRREDWTSDDPGPSTRFLSDNTRSIIATNNSPDVGFDASVNPYRGCEHGCAYCFARPNHEYLGFSAGLDFESRILVKEDAPELLAVELARRAWKPQPVAMSGVTDPYQPIERRLELTRRCLSVLARFRNPAAIITKSDLVLRDRDLLGEMAGWNGALVHLSITTLDPVLGRAMEPRAATPGKRLEAIRGLAAAGIPVGVLVAPVVPGLTDHEIPAILAAAAQAGARFAGYVPLRLPYGVGEIFEAWLTRHVPLQKDKVLHRIESIREGRRNDPDYGTRMTGSGAFAAQVGDLFRLGCRQSGLNRAAFQFNVSAFAPPGGRQISLFGPATDSPAG